MSSFLFGFNGRVRRSHYFLAAIAVCLVSNLFGLAAIGAEVDVVDDFEGWSLFVTPDPLVSAVAALVGLLAFWASLALAAKRWHDVGATGWLALIALIPGASFAMFLLLCIIPGNKGANRYGPDPRLEGGVPAAAE